MREWVYIIEKECCFLVVFEIYKICFVCLVKCLNRRKKLVVFWLEFVICFVVCILIKFYDLLYCLLLLVIKVYVVNFSGYILDV